ncbi:MAG TPA: hypothetical protein VGV09_07550 [Steroidobacteraceae bacterium]|nr:hypothetical protein [Steroidobacteraceae bacterium]
MADAPKETADSAPVRWNTIEIVTNDFESVERLRKATGIPLGGLLPKDDPRVGQACDAVRRAAPRKEVSCRELFGSPQNGYAEAEFIVEISDDRRVPQTPIHCSAGHLSSDLIALRDEWGQARSTTPGWGSTEHVNALQYLDYDAPRLHELAARTHFVVSPRARELEKISSSCTADSRADALGFLNFTGAASSAIRVAAAHMGDPDPNVRNAAARLIGVFNGYISKREVAGIVRSACALTYGGFVDRNKSLILLDRMRLRGLVRFRDLDLLCQGQIRAIARTSNSIQTGRAAQDLVESVDAKVRK